MTDSQPAPSSSKEPPEISGRWVVLGMFGFAMLLVGAMYVYWHYHRQPFLPLQTALAEEFPDTEPRVEGGRRKKHKGTPQILRITMRVGFNPTEDEQQAAALADRVTAFTTERFDLTGYDELEIHFFWPEPEQEIHQWSVTKDVAGLVEKGHN
ncbi:MAG: hypothetical protein ACREJB_14645 [Planctomycetaceae bacterium]